LSTHNAQVEDEKEAQSGAQMGEVHPNKQKVKLRQ
jgi:hypothetical protein